VQLEPGDRVFIYSDGVEIACGDADTVDSAVWRKMLHSLRDLPTEQIVQRLSEVSATADRKRDDVTLIAIDVEAA